MVNPGKVKCEILKAIRKKIAENNNIPFYSHNCEYEGICTGTCPMCESELRSLTEQLKKIEKSKISYTLDKEIESRLRQQHF